MILSPLSPFCFCLSYLGSGGWNGKKSVEKGRRKNNTQSSKMHALLLNNFARNTSSIHSSGPRYCFLSFIYYLFDSLSPIHPLDTSAFCILIPVGSGQVIRSKGEEAVHLDHMLQSIIKAGKCRNSSKAIKAETTESPCVLVCSLWFAQAPCLYSSFQSV